MTGRDATPTVRILIYLLSRGTNATAFGVGHFLIRRGFE